MIGLYSNLVTEGRLGGSGQLDLHPPPSTMTSVPYPVRGLGSGESNSSSMVGGDGGLMEEEVVYLGEVGWRELVGGEGKVEEEGEEVLVSDSSEHRYVYLQLFNVKEPSSPSLQQPLPSHSTTHLNTTKGVRQGGSSSNFHPFLFKVKPGKGTKLKLGDKDCFISRSILRGTLGPYLNQSPFVLSSTRSKIQLEDWKVLIWPATEILLKEVVVEIAWELDEQEEEEDWEPALLKLKETFQGTKKPIRQGQILSLSSEDGNFTIKFIYTEPTLQGFLTDTTNIILTRAVEEPLQLSESYYASSVSTTSLASSSDLHSNSSVSINPLQFISTPRRIHKMLSGNSSPLISPTRRASYTSNSSDLKLGEGHRTTSDGLFETIWPIQASHAFTILPIENCSLWSQLLPGFQPSEIDPHSSILVPLKALSALRVVSGDWVITKILGSDSRPPRWCQIFGISQRQMANLGWFNKEVVGKDLALVDPVLLFNLKASGGSATQESTITLAVQKVLGMDSPGLATSVTLARVASPIANQKSLQGPIANSLRSHLSLTRRSVCLGDIIPVLVDEATAQLSPQITGDGNLDESFSLSLPSAKVLAFFKVTDILTVPEANASSEEIYALVHSGLFIDSVHTKTLQHGVEHSNLPLSLRSYYGLKKQRDYQNNQSFQRLQSLIQSCLNPQASALNIQCSVLIYGPRGSGKSDLVKEVADRLGLHLLELYCYDWVEESDSKTQENFSEWFNKVPTYAPCILLLRNLDGLAKKFAPSDVQQEPWLSTMFADLMRRLATTERKLSYPIVIVGTSESLEKFPSGIVSSFRHEIQIEAPDEKVRQTILQNLLSVSSIAPDVSIASIATETAALVANDLVDLVGRAGSMALDRLAKFSTESGTPAPCLVRSGVTVLGTDFEQALNQSRSQYSDSIGAPKIPNVTWDDVGGLASVKSDILDTIQLPLQHPELFTSGAKKRSGILLYGPPGTGKTLLAKAVATSCALNFFSVKGPELLNMYIGESEANVRRVFQKARDAKPCVIFFDELDSVAPKRGEQGDSGGVMDRIVSQLLAELDGMGDSGSSGEVFVIGATNRPDLLDPALLRPGRFDKMLYLGVSQDHDSQLNIIQALTRKFRLDPQLDLRKFVDQCPFHFTGADFYALCSDAMLKAMSRTANEIEIKVENLNAERAVTKPAMTVPYYLDHVAHPEEIQVLVGLSDFEKALDELTPSVTPSELAHYAEIRRKFANQTLNGPPSPHHEVSHNPFLASLPAGSFQLTSMEDPPFRREEGAPRPPTHPGSPPTSQGPTPSPPVRPPSPPPHQSEPLDRDDNDSTYHYQTPTGPSPHPDHLTTPLESPQLDPPTHQTEVPSPSLSLTTKGEEQSTPDSHPTTTTADQI